MILQIINHEFQYEAEKLTRIFFPNEIIKVVTKKEKTTNECVLLTEFNEYNVKVAFYDENGVVVKSLDEKTEKCNDKELVMASMMFEILTQVTQYTPKWGILTGIRPSKLLRSLKSQFGDLKGKEVFENSYFVSPQKSCLADSVAKVEEKTIRLSQANSFSLYVSIPFCPTRCSYCSFVSHSMTSEIITKLMPDYLEHLIKEIEITAKISKSLGLRLETIYFGGGTPTTLTANQLDLLIKTIENNFDLSTVREYTIEAGRPDTINQDKLIVMKNGGVSRISINPQTFNDSVLKEIGRCHTVQLTEDVFMLARKLGFDNINMDLIAGLPADTYESFCNSLGKALSFTPENITVHTLALKRSSSLGTQDGRVAVEKGKLASQMIDYAYDNLILNDYYPYYMYRQSKSLGNLENTGYCLNNRECLYNIFMMEECHTILAVGAGAVTKLKAPTSEKIDRVFNYKYPHEYINGFDEILNRKKVIIPFYENIK